MIDVPRVSPTSRDAPEAIDAAASSIGSCRCPITAYRPRSSPTCEMPDDDCFLINLGDLTAEWTNDRWCSTLHRCWVPERCKRRR